MKKILLPVALILLLILAGGWYIFHSEKTSLLEKMAKVTKREGIQALEVATDEKGNQLKETAGLAIKGINLFQGDNGVELWRLKASWAHLTQENGNINVDQPVIRYALGDASSATPDADVLDVKALKGKITGNHRYLSLWDQVIITRYDDIITAQCMDYDSNTRTMTFPQGAMLQGPKATGTAGVFSWDLATNTLVGTHGVVVVIKARDDSAEAQEIQPSTPKSAATTDP